MLGGRGFRNVVYACGGPIAKKTTKSSSEEFLDQSNQIYTNGEGNKNMSKWVQVSLSDFLYNTNFKDKEIYIDDIGFYKVTGANIEVNNRSLSTFYVKEKFSYKRLSEEEDLKKFIDDFTKKRNVMLYSASSTIYRNVSASNISYQKVEYDNIRLILNGRKGSLNSTQNAFTYYNNLATMSVFIDKNKEQTIYINTGKPYSLNVIHNDNLREKMKVFCYGNGTVTIEKLYSYPYEKGYKCEVLTPNGELEKIDINTPLYYLPYQSVDKSPLDIFNESKNEKKLMPIRVKDNSEHNLINLYWEKIENASNYIVEIYKLILNKDKSTTIYHLSTVEVSREKRYYSTRELINENIVYVIKAENKSGKIIAQSRGILYEKPQDWS